MIIVFDLEGPLSPMDHAAEAMRLVGKKLGRGDFFEFFQMLSLYDDELTLEEKPGYNPGDTLRLIAPIISTNLTDEELKQISLGAALTPGAKDLISSLNPNDVYVASTSYQQHAHTIAERLGLKHENVNCTMLPEFSEFPYMDRLLEIFENYKSGGMSRVKRELDELFWGEMEYEYLKTRVCGGERKMEVVEKISEERGVAIENFIVVGDSITDINMLEGVKENGGIAISFNGNQYSVPRANLAVSALSLMALRPVVEAYPDVWRFVENWNYAQDKLRLLSSETRSYFEQHSLFPHYDVVRPSEIDEIIKRQKVARLAMRKEYGKLT